MKSKRIKKSHAHNNKLVANANNMGNTSWYYPVVSNSSATITTGTFSGSGTTTVTWAANGGQYSFVSPFITSYSVELCKEWLQRDCFDDLKMMARDTTFSSLVLDVKI